MCKFSVMSILIRFMLKSVAIHNEKAKHKLNEHVHLFFYNFTLVSLIIELSLVQ